MHPELIITLIRDIIRDTKWDNKVYVAGGYCRDKILGVPSKDIDLLVDADNGGIEFATWLAKELDVFKEESNPVIYPRFGTAKLTYKGEDIECVMPRGEIYTADSRKPEVFQATLRDDVFRRDFTINTILFNVSTSEYVDLTEMGQQDIKDGRIRTPLDPNVTFFDDPLRMLRAVRQGVKYNFEIDEDVKVAIQNNAYRLGGDNKYGTAISVERINDEFSKMLLLDRPSIAMELLAELGLMKYIIPELLLLRGMEQNKYHKWDVWGHTMNVLDNTSPILINRLGGLLHDIGKAKTKTVTDSGIHFYEHEFESAKMSQDILRELKFSNDEIKAVSFICKYHMRTKSFGDDLAKVKEKSFRKFFDKVAKYLPHVLDVIHADNISHADEYNMPNQVKLLEEKFLELYNIGGMDSCGRVILPIDGDDIMETLGIKPSPIVKEYLDFTRKICYSRPLITKEEILKQIKTDYARKK